MRRRTFACAALLLVLSAGAPANAQTDLESFVVYSDHPRLFLRPQRLRLLRREVERKSLRWDQFETLMRGGAVMPEPAFADALYFQATEDKSFGRKSVEWVLGKNRDVRQTALVYDWCQDVMTPAEKRTVAARLREAIGRPSGTSISDLRSKLLAALALGGDDKTASEKAIREVIHDQWLGRIIPALRAGNPVIHGNETFALLEILHAVRDNLNADLREDFPAYFKQLPLFDLLSYYPPPYPAPENDYRIPFSAHIGEPDLRLAALSRAGELAIVAFDTNAPESQVLQGWLMNDHFLMRGTFGIPYEFLWANPYQPGLSYYHVPLVLHDEIFGRLLVRSSWDDDALWAGYIDGQLQEFREGRVVSIDPHADHEPIDLDEATIFFGPRIRKLPSGSRDANDIFIVGLTPNTRFHIEVDDEEMYEADSAAGGILYLKGLRPGVVIRFNPQSESSGSPGLTNPVGPRPAAAQSTRQGT